MKKFSPVLPDDYFARYYFDIRARDLGSKGKERWRACLLETEKTIPFSIGMMFAKDVVTPLAANKVLLRCKSSYSLLGICIPDVDGLKGIPQREYKRFFTSEAKQ